MQGTHTVEGFMRYIENHPNMPLFLKVSLKAKLKNVADRVSATGKTGCLALNSVNSHLPVVIIRVFPDGSCEAGYDTKAKWPGGTEVPQFIPPPEDEI